MFDEIRNNYYSGSTKEGLITEKGVRLWKDCDVTLQEFPEFLKGSKIYPIERLGVS